MGITDLMDIIGLMGIVDLMHIMDDYMFYLIFLEKRLNTGMLDVEM